MTPSWLTNYLSRNIPGKIVAVTLVVIASIFFITACDNNTSRTGAITLTGLTMGTTYTVKVNEPGSNYDSLQIKISVDKLLEDLNAKMSTYLPDSELSQVNRSSSTDWINISDDLYTVIKMAINISNLSNGAFDITTGSLVNIWGFGPVEKQDIIPDDKLVQSTLLDTGFRKIHLNDTSKAIKKDRANIYLDLSGIAKGYAADRIAQLLRERYAIHNYLVEIGGEIQAKGVNPDNQAWRIGIEKPVSTLRAVERIISLDNIGMATSGDYRNFFEENGTHYSHIIDPRTGRPVKHQLISVTVLHVKSMIADAWATALQVLGPEQGMELANSLDLPVFFIVKNQDGFRELMSAGFKQYLHLIE
jgi:thiamine biosynthesis lipoprotein